MKRVLFTMFAVIAAGCTADAQITTASLWGRASGLTVQNITSSEQASFGTKFTTNVAGVITKLIFYKNPNDTATSRSLYLWSTGARRPHLFPPPSYELALIFHLYLDRFLDL